MNASCQYSQANKNSQNEIIKKKYCKNENNLKMNQIDVNIWSIKISSTSKNVYKCCRCYQKASLTVGIYEILFYVFLSPATDGPLELRFHFSFAFFSFFHLQNYLLDCQSVYHLQVSVFFCRIFSFLIFISMFMESDFNICFVTSFFSFNTLAIWVVMLFFPYLCFIFINFLAISSFWIFSFLLKSQTVSSVIV